MNSVTWLSTETQGQTFIQLGELTLALVLSTFIGLEREFRVKSAGLRTHTLVGAMRLRLLGRGDLESLAVAIGDLEAVVAVKMTPQADAQEQQTPA
jgi:hypothetical protein